VTNWGSDIYLFGRLREHEGKVREILAACDYYHCECRRDVELARSLGLRGEPLPVCPISGGFDVKGMRALAEPGPPSAKRVIALKGFQTWAGRALVGLRAIEMCADALAGYTVKIYGATADVMIAGELLMAKTGIPLELNDMTMGRSAVLRVHGSARVSIGLSISDAISTSLLEAMIMGSFPIQSDTSCAGEWVRDGESGLIVPAEDPGRVAEAIRRAVADDGLVDRAAAANLKVARERLDASVIRPKVVAMYETMLARGRADGRASS
jgi:glycosyltransferase involved in cell wall biosynthesis